MNINEIARLAGVSRATVSRYLNDGYVSEEKKQAIRTVIEKTGYEPSQQARNLRSKVTKLIGVIIPRIQSEAVSRMVAGISEVLSKQGYQLLLANTDNNTKEELKYLRIFRKNQVDGIIFMGTMFSKEHLKEMQEVDVPIVVAAQELDNYSCVYQDDYHAACKATEALLVHGKTYGYIGVTAKDKAVGGARKKGFLDTLQKAGIRNLYDHSSVQQCRVCVSSDSDCNFGYESVWRQPVFGSGYRNDYDSFGSDQCMERFRNGCFTDSDRIGMVWPLRYQAGRLSGTCHSCCHCGMADVCH